MVMELVVKAIDARDYEEFARHLTVDCAFEAPGVSLRGPEQAWAWMTPFLDAFPDIEHRVVSSVVSGPTESTELTITGTHTAPLVSPDGAIPATGRPITLAAIDTLELDGEGRIVSYRVHFDTMDFLAQLGLLPGNGAPAPESAGGDPQAPEAVLRSLIEAINRGDFKAVMALIAPDAVDHTPVPGQGPGREGWAAKWQMLAGAFSDVRFDIEECVANQDTVCSRYTMRAVHTGPFMGAPATGLPIEVVALDMVRVRNGRITDHWGLIDQNGLLDQLGLLGP
jgi:steroid delta-isomerase-like uncharacterized protein